MTRLVGDPAHAVDEGWEALRQDSLPWLLDLSQPNLQWRALVELFQRPGDSPAVRKARGAASAAEPVAGLLAELDPDGSWATRASRWTTYRGTGWRLVAAVLWGADTADPRLQAAAERLLETAPGVGGLARTNGGSPELALTGRAVQALATLGWTRHPRLQEATAWLVEVGLAEDAKDLLRLRELTIAATATLAAAAWFDRPRKQMLRLRASEVLLSILDDPRAARSHGGLRLGFPNLLRTDIAEMLWALARAGCDYDERLGPTLRRLQLAQSDQGRWCRVAGVPATLPVSAAARPAPGAESRWITLEAAVALLRFAVAAGLPRLFPARPGS